MRTPPRGAARYPSSSWCGREDSNFHGCYPTATSTLRVYQFRHDRIASKRGEALTKGRAEGKPENGPVGAPIHQSCAGAAKLGNAAGTGWTEAPAPAP